MNKTNRVVTFHWGLLASLLITGIAACLLASLTLYGVIAENQINAYCTVLQTVSCVIGFVMAGRMTKKRIAIQIIFCMVGYSALTMFVGVVILNSSLQNIGGTILSATIAMLLSCALCIRKPRSFNMVKKGYRT